MAEDQEASNEIDEGVDGADYDTNDANDINDTNDITATTTIPPPIIEDPTDPIEDPTNPIGEDYGDEEDLPEVTVNLIINDLPDGVTLPSDLVNAGLTDIYGNKMPTTSWIDSINDYTGAITQDIYDDGTNKVAGKGWWGAWSWNKALFVGLIALCVIGIILALVFLIVGKKFKKNKGGKTAAGSVTTKKSVGTKGGSPKSKYSEVPTDV